MSDIQQFKMEDVQKRVSETIKAQFAMLIPDEAFDAMTVAAITEFFESEVAMKVKEVTLSGNSYYSTKAYELSQRLSPFKVLLWEQIRRLTEERLKEWMEAHKAEVERDLSKVFETDDTGPQLLKGLANMKIQDLALRMAQVQHTAILQAAAHSAGMQIQSFAGQAGLPYQSNTGYFAPDWEKAAKP